MSKRSLEQPIVSLSPIDFLLPALTGLLPEHLRDSVYSSRPRERVAYHRSPAWKPHDKVPREFYRTRRQG